MHTIDLYYTDLIKNYTDSDLIINLNKENSVNNNKRVIAICAILIKRISIAGKGKLNTGDLADLLTSLYIYVKSKKSITLNQITKLLRNEAIAISNKYNYSKYLSNADLNINNNDEEEEFDFSKISDKVTEEDEFRNKSISNTVIKRIYKLTPTNLKPLIYHYLDTGIILHQFLSYSDKCILFTILQSLNYSFMNSEELAELVPISFKEKLVFTGDLSKRSPIILALLILFEGDLNKLLTFTEIFGDNKLTIPNTSSVKSVLKESTNSAKQVLNNTMNTDQTSNAFITSLISNFKLSEGEKVASNFIELLFKALNKEFDTYSAGLDKIINRIDQISNSDVYLFFRIMNKELNGSINLIKELNELR